MLWHRQVLLGTVAAVALLVANGIASAADPIRIAVAGPFSGQIALYGEMQKAGVLMALDRINALGGVDGRMLKAILVDDACRPQQALAVAEQVVEAGIKLVVGHLCSGATQAASVVYEREGVLMVTPAATNPAITSRGFKLVFRTIGLDSQQGPVAGRFILENIEPRSIAIVHDNQQYGRGIAEAVRDFLENAGANVVLFEEIHSGQTDFAGLIDRMKQANVDFVYYGGYHPELGPLLRQSREQQFEARFMGPDGVGNKGISDLAGDASEGLLVTLPADFSAFPENAELVKAFTDKGQDPSGPIVMPSYAAVQIIADAIQSTGGLDIERIADALRNSTYETPIGQVEFDEKGDLDKFRFLIYEWHADGTKRPVQP